MPGVTPVDSTADFTEFVNGDRLVVVCFSAVWCAPCQQMSEALEKLTYEFPNVEFIKVDADNNRDIVNKCQVRSLPTFLCVRKGESRGYVVGADIGALKECIRSSQ
jgi:thioredoxin 1